MGGNDSEVTKTVIDLMRDMHQQNLQILTQVTESRGEIKLINQRLQYGDDHMKRTDDLIVKLSDIIKDHSHPCIENSNCKDVGRSLFQIPLRWGRLISYIIYVALALGALLFGTLVERFSAKAAEIEKPKVTLTKGEYNK